MLVQDTSEIPYFPMEKGRDKVIVDGEHMTMDLGEIDAGAYFPEHSHPHEQIGYAMDGRCELIIDGTTYQLEKGYSYRIPSNAKHAWRNNGEETFVFLDAFHPPREDLLRGVMDIDKWKTEPED
jgi:quercetin dioxygenase-like cupin family protein